VDAAGYRIVQEALTNALRHAGAVPTEVVVDAGDELLIEVRSRLSTQSTAGAGRGVLGMRERVALHDGSLEAGPEGADWVVRARMPV
jgi:signal transduction histidine kinase